MTEDSIVKSEHVKLAMSFSDEKGWESSTDEESSAKREMSKTG